MRSPARLRIAASFLAIASAAACGDSTSPGQTAADIAAHFDSIAIHANTQAETNDLYQARAFITTLLELPAALGAVPSKVDVTTADGVEHWKAYEVMELNAPSSTTRDSSFALLMFRDSDAHTALLAEFDASGNIDDAAMLTGDTIFVSPDDGSGTTSIKSTSSACTTPSASLLNPGLSTFNVGTCNLAKFLMSMQLTSLQVDGMDPALTDLSFSNVDVNGVRLVDADESGTVRRLKDALRVIRASRRH